MSILNDLKIFLSANQILPTDSIFFNFDDDISPSDKLILICNGGEFNDIARKTIVSVISKSLSMQNAESIIYNTYDLFCPAKQYEKPLLINGKLMLIKALHSPLYKEKEKNGKHVFTFDLNIIHTR